MISGRSELHMLVTAMLLLTVFLHVHVPEADAAVGAVSFHLAMPGEEQTSNAQGDPVMICGVLYYLNITLSEYADSVVIDATYAGNSSADDYTGHYVFSYNVSDGFGDPLYGEYLRGDMSRVENGSYTFAVGTHASAAKGMWYFNISAGNTSVGRYEVEFRQANVGMSISSPTILFVVEPFNASILTNDYAFFNLANTGNVPTELTVTVDMFEDRLNITNTSSVFRVGDRRRCEVTFNADSMLPQRQVFKGHAESRCAVFITKDMVNFIPEIAADFDIIVEVRRADYNVLDLGNAVIQYHRLLSVKYGDTLETDIWLSGKGPLRVDIGHLNLEEPVIRIDGMGTVDGTGFYVNLVEGEEIHVTFTTKGSRADSTAYLNYSLDADGSRGAASTKVIVTGRPTVTYTTTGGETGGWLAAIIIIVIVAVGVGFVVYQYRQAAKLDHDAGTARGEQPPDKGKKR